MRHANIQYLLPLFALALIVSGACSRSEKQRQQQIKSVTLDLTSAAQSCWLAEGNQDAPAEPLSVNHIGRYDEVFNDSNYVHWTAASKIGIRPLSNLRSHWNPGRPLVKIASCSDFFLEKLTFSQPYLVPEAAEILHEIGRRFRDSVHTRGGGDYRIRVTSVLRTPANVRRLRRCNSNAIDSSVHQLGTTVDISYNAFAADPGSRIHTAAALKGVLAEVLLAMRNEGKILIKYEKKQPCFHVSAIAQP